MLSFMICCRLKVQVNLKQDCVLIFLQSYGVEVELMLKLLQVKVIPNFVGVVFVSVY